MSHTNCIQMTMSMSDGYVVCYVVPLDVPHAIFSVEMMDSLQKFNKITADEINYSTLT